MIAAPGSSILPSPSVSRRLPPFACHWSSRSRSCAVRASGVAVWAAPGGGGGAPAIRVPLVEQIEELRGAGVGRRAPPQQLREDGFELHRTHVLGRGLVHRRGDRRGRLLPRPEVLLQQ